MYATILTQMTCKHFEALSRHFNPKTDRILMVLLGVKLLPTRTWVYHSMINPAIEINRTLKQFTKSLFTTVQQYF